jgi:hypothetical protein
MAAAVNDNHLTLIEKKNYFYKIQFYDLDNYNNLSAYFLTRFKV